MSFFTSEKKSLTNQLASQAQRDYFYLDPFWSVKLGTYIINSDSLWVVLSNTGMCLRGSKLCGESGTWQVLLVSKMKIGGNNAFFRDN